MASINTLQHNLKELFKYAKLGITEDEPDRNYQFGFIIHDRQNLSDALVELGRLRTRMKVMEKEVEHD